MDGRSSKKTKLFAHTFFQRECGVAGGVKFFVTQRKRHYGCRCSGRGAGSGRSGAADLVGGGSNGFAFLPPLPPSFLQSFFAGEFLCKRKVLPELFPVVHEIGRFRTTTLPVYKWLERFFVFRQGYSPVARSGFCIAFS